MLDEPLPLPPPTTSVANLPIFVHNIGAREMSEEEQPALKRMKEEEIVSQAKGTDKDKEFEVPMSTVHKLLKTALPEGAICTKEAKSAFSKAAGIFVLYVTACANEIAKDGKRTTINGQDITTALNELGYAAFLPHVEAAMEKQKMESQIRKGAGKKKDAAAAGPAAASSS